MEARVVRSNVLQAPESPRRYLLDLIVRVGTNRCQLLVRYSQNRHRSETIEQIAKTLIEAMKNVMRREKSRG